MRRQHLLTVLLSAMCLLGMPDRTRAQDPARRKLADAPILEAPQSEVKAAPAARDLNLFLSVSLQEAHILALEADNHRHQAFPPWERVGTTDRSPDSVAFLKLALEEFEFLHGFRGMVDHTERRLDRFARKFKLKGKLTFTDDDPRRMELSEEIQMDGGIDLQPRKVRAHRGFWERLLPSKIEWKLGSNLKSEYLTGQINIGSHFQIEGNVGNDSELVGAFVFPF